MKHTTLVLLLFVGIAYGQTTDWNSLVGKRVVAQRMPLFEPGTYKQVSLDYAGKQATIIAVKPFALPQMRPEMLARMSPEAREQFNLATVTVQFDDGTRADTGGALPYSQIPNHFEIMADQPASPAASSAPAAATSAVAPATTPDSTATPATPAAMPVAVAKPAAPDPNEMTPEEIQRAINGEGKDHWVSIQDMGLMAAQGNQVPTINLFMPEAVLASRAASAKKQFIQFEPAAEDKRKALMVVAHGYAGKTIGEGCTSITRVVLLSDPSGKLVKEAYLSEPLGETWQNAFGATNHCQALRTKFTLDDVQKVKAAAPDGEFLVAVFSGAVNTKMYKIKKKHQAKLGLR